MQKLEQIYEGKAKKVYSTEDPNLVIVDYKDDATAFNGLKKGTIVGKGVINNQMTNRLMAKMEKAGIPTHFVEELSERETLVKRVEIVPLEVIIRNISAGSFAKHYGVEEGIVFDAPTIEFSYKNDDLGDPLINEYHALALKLASKEEIEQIKKYAFAVNDVLKAFWRQTPRRLRHPLPLPPQRPGPLRRGPRSRGTGPRPWPRPPCRRSRPPGRHPHLRYQTLYSLRRFPARGCGGLYRPGGARHAGRGLPPRPPGAGAR